LFYKRLSLIHLFINVLNFIKMKKKVLSGLFALALLATAGYGVNQKVKSNAYLSDLALANVEALAGGEVTVEQACMHTCQYCKCYYPPIDVDPEGYWADYAEPYL
jgi:hypothetical protein